MNHQIKIRLMGDANDLQIFSALLETIAARKIIAIAEESARYPIRGSSKEFQKDIKIEMLIDGGKF